MKSLQSTSTMETPAQAIAAALEKEVTPERLALALSDGLNATTHSRSGVVETDFRTRLQAASLILSYQVGRPKERETPVPATPEQEGTKDLLELLQRSPALRNRIRSILAEAETSPEKAG